MAEIDRPQSFVPIVIPEAVKQPLRVAFPVDVDLSTQAIILDIALLRQHTSDLDRRIEIIDRLAHNVGQLAIQVAHVQADVANSTSRINETSVEIVDFEDRIDVLERCSSLIDERVTGLIKSKEWLVGIYFTGLVAISSFIALVLDFYHIAPDRIFK